MPALRDPLHSIALSHYSDRLRAVFAPITAEIRKGGRLLADDEGSFYQSVSFKWSFYVKDFFDSYHSICDRKQVEPIYLDPKLKSALKVPFADIETLRLLQDTVVKRFLQFRERRIYPFSKIPEYPSPQDINNALRLAGEDKDIRAFLSWCSSLPADLAEYIRRLEKLSGAYEQRINAYVEAIKIEGSDEKAKAKLNESKQKIREILDPYIRHLKAIGVIPKSWTYSFKGIPLIEAERIGKESGLGVSKSDIDHITRHWESDTLPPRKEIFISTEEKNRYMAWLFAEAKKASEAGMLEVEVRPTPKPSVKPAPKPTPSPVPKPKPMERKKPVKTRRYRKSLWRRFDEWVTGVGDWFAYKMHDISEWMMEAWIWFLAAYVVIALIVIWINEGFFEAFMGALVIFFIIGVLSSVLSFIVALITLIVKYITYVPLFILRCIFYRGWTFLLVILAICGFVAYKILQVNYII